MDKVDVILYGNFTPSPETLSSLEMNTDYINKVITSKKTALVTNFEDISISVQALDGDFKNEAEEKNKLMQYAETDYVLLLRTDFALDEDLIEELLDELEEQRVDIVYPNLVIKAEEEKVVNFPDLCENENTILHGLAVEECLPESALLFRKNLIAELGKFNEFLNEFDFYEFIYRNAKHLRLKLAPVSYAIQKPMDTFIDTSYRSYVIRNTVLRNYDWRKDIFPFLSWDKNPKVAKATACTLVGNRLFFYYDYFNAAEFYRRALLEFHNRETLKQLITTYLNMGFFDEAKKLISEHQGMEKEEVEKLIYYVDKLESLVEELEKAVEEGKVVETIVALQEVTGFYSGAPIHNILGVIKWIEKKSEEAYKFFFKAVTMNPINRDYLYNLSETAKQLRKESEVVDLIDRLLKEVR